MLNLVFLASFKLVQDMIICILREELILYLVRKLNLYLREELTLYLFRSYFYVCLYNIRSGAQRAP